MCAYSGLGCDRRSFIMSFLSFFRVSIFLVPMLIDFSDEKVNVWWLKRLFYWRSMSFQRLGFFFSNFKLKFEPKYMNLSVDMSIYKENTKKHPVYLVPEATIEIFEDIPRLHVRLDDSVYLELFLAFRSLYLPKTWKRRKFWPIERSTFVTSTASLTRTSSCTLCCIISWIIWNSPSNAHLKR